MSNINYFRTLTKEESKEIEKELDEYFLSLDYNTKQKIKSLIEGFQSQILCEHKWIDPNTYENELPKDKLFCRCGATKLTPEAEKIHEEKEIKKAEKWMFNTPTQFTTSSNSNENEKNNKS